LQIIRGFQIFGIGVLLTYPVAQFYADQRLYVLIPLVCVSALLDGFLSPSIHVLHRRLDLGRLTLYELGLQIIGTILLIWFCWLSPTAIANASAVVLTALIHTVTSHFLVRGYTPKLAWDGEVLKELRSFGRWVAVASIFMFIAEQSDRMILGKLLSFQEFGVYIIAYTLAGIPRDVIRHLSSRVIFPAVSSQIELPRAELRSKLLKPRGMVLLGAALLLAIMTCGGDWLVIAMYAARNQNWAQYQAATWMMPILAAGIWFAVLFHSMSPVLLAIGKPAYSAQSNFARFLVVAVGLPIAYYFYQTLGAIAVIAFSDLPLYVVNVFALRKEGLSCTAQDMRATLFFAVTLAALLALRYALGYGLPIQLLWKV
jgi:O-antigen/teichoic acid export membrane protein